MNKITHDIDEVYLFFKHILPPVIDDEVYFISLSARNKYLTEEEKELYKLGRSEMFCRQIIREYNFEKFIKTLKGFERNEGSYLTKSNHDIPQKCMVCYININPSSTLRAYKEFNNVMTDYLYESIKASDKTDVMKRITKMNTLLLNCYQKNRV